MNVQHMKISALLLFIFLSSTTIQAAEAIQKGSVHVVKSLQDFNTYIKSGNYIVAYFGALKCGPCRAFHDTYYGMAQEYPDVIFLDITYENVPQSEQLLNRFVIRSFPTFIFFDKNGNKVNSFTGANESTKGKIVANIVQMKDAGCPAGTVLQKSVPVQPTQQVPQQQKRIQQPVQQPVQPIQQRQPVKQVQPMPQQPMRQPVQAQPMQQPMVQQPQPMRQQPMQQQPMQKIIYYPEQGQQGEDQGMQKRPVSKSRRGRFSKKSVRRPRQKQTYAQ